MLRENLLREQLKCNLQGKSPIKGEANSERARATIDKGKVEVANSGFLDTLDTVGLGFTFLKKRVQLHRFGHICFDPIRIK